MCSCRFYYAYLHTAADIQMPAAVYVIHLYLYALSVDPDEVFRACSGYRVFDTQPEQTYYITSE